MSLNPWNRVPSLPRAVSPLVAFAPFLRRHGFAVAPEQVICFLEGTRLVQPDSLEAMRLIARATLAPPAQRLSEFDRLYRRFFAGLQETAIGEGERREKVSSLDDEDAVTGLRPREADSDQASGAELLATRALDDSVDAQLRRFARNWKERRPQRRGFRCRADNAGVTDLRRSLRDLARHDGDVTRVRRMKRQLRPRRLLVLIDISGSMKKQTEEYLQLAHAILHATPQCEVLCIGTRITRITAALAQKDLGLALQQAALCVPDWDGGTRIGPAMVNLLASVRHASFARGALVLVLSDGLERGDPLVLVDAVARLARRAWKLVWATPLASDANYRPVTAAMTAMLPHLDALIDGGSVERITYSLLQINQPAPRALEVWSKKGPIQ